MSAKPVISFVIATHNRREVVCSTLQRIRSMETKAAPAEIIVVDNASNDGTRSAIASQYPEVRLVALNRNLGSCAKAVGAEQALGRYVIFLDDDSYPRPGGIERMIGKFQRDPRLAAAGFCAHLPDGRQECSALPDVFIGCGVGFRREALSAVGGLDRTLFMQAEEYDLSFRLINAGWKVRTFVDLIVDHLKAPEARRGARTIYYDTRNNLILIARYLPGHYETEYRNDWAQRYRWIATDAGRRAVYWRAWAAAMLQRRRQRRRFRHHRLSADAVDRIFGHRYVHDRMMALARQGLRTIVLADLGKNILPFAQAACRARLEVLCIADDRFAAAGRSYRGLPIRRLPEAVGDRPEAIVVSNTSPYHAAQTAVRIASVTDVPVHRWFGYDVPSCPWADAGEQSTSGTTDRYAQDKATCAPTSRGGTVR